MAAKSTDKSKTERKRGPYSIPSIYPLSEELRPHQKIRVADAARLNAMHEDTFRSEFGHLIKTVTKRLQVVELGDAIAIGKQPKS